MKIKNENSFLPAPTGIHQAVCVDIVDLGMVQGQYGPKHKCRLVWEIEEKMPNGKRFIVMKNYGVSLHKKAILRADLKNWRGQDFNEEEAKEFDLDKVLHAPAQLVVTHNLYEGSTYANVTAIIKSKAHMAPSGDYVRVKDRPGYKAPSMEVADSHSQADAGDMHESDQPF